MKTRLIVVTVLLSLFGTALIIRLFYLQVVRHDYFLAQSEKQYHSTMKTHYGRGSIYDRNRHILAANIEVESVFVNPADVIDKARTAGRLASVLKLDRRAVLKKISARKHFVWIKRKAGLRETAILKNYPLSGVGFVEEHKRVYPKREMAAHTLGFVGMDNQGLAGIEHYQHELLKGSTSLVVIEKDARGRQIRTAALAGRKKHKSRDLVLTLDEVIQFITESHLKKQVEKYQAKSGVAIVMAPYTGEIYALANIPRFNPNLYAAYPRESWKNNVIASVYEPGSIFKPVLAAAALDSGTVRPGDIFYCENGRYRVGHVSIGEAANHKFGWLSLQGIITKSSNIGSIKVAQKLGAARYHEYMRRFGFGGKTGVGLPGEAGGKLRPVSRWSSLSLASLSFGHEISVTPLQMAAAISAIANGGNLMRPRIVRSVLQDGVVVKRFGPEVVRRVISQKTSRQMIDILKRVVEKGTGKNAALEGFDVAGKTGTAQKLDPETGTYSKTKYLSSFIGFIPAHAPQLAILVMIDEPRGGYYGGTVAAPVFRKIAEQVLRYLNVPSSNDQVFILDRA